jgi:septal ring factor EnvC (AmiA/AmiB activator)
MFSPDFDPLQMLQDLQRQVNQCSHNLSQLNHALNQQRELQQQVIDQLNIQTAAINSLDTIQTDIKQRLIHLERINEHR